MIKSKDRHRDGERAKLYADTLIVAFRVFLICPTIGYRGERRCVDVLEKRRRAGQRWFKKQNISTRQWRQMNRHSNETSTPRHTAMNT